MPSPDEVFSEMESDRATREGEIRLIENASKKVAAEDERGMLRRTSILLTYAHLEGFCRFALSAYIAAVNSFRIECGVAAYPLVAATLTKVFAALRDPNSKHPEFRRQLPDDAKLYLTAREAEFVENMDDIFRTPIEIPESAIDLESNLKAIVLKKNLFKLGLNYPSIEGQQHNLDKLLGIRNAIAHGDLLKIPDEKQVEEYTALAFRTMQFVQIEIFDALRKKTYLRNAEAPP